MSTLSRSDPLPNERLSAHHTTPGHPKKATAFSQEVTEAPPCHDDTHFLQSPTKLDLFPQTSGITNCSSATSRKCLVHRTVILRKGPHHSLMRRALKGRPRSYLQWTGGGAGYWTYSPSLPRPVRALNCRLSPRPRAGRAAGCFLPAIPGGGFPVWKGKESVSP